MPPAIGARAVIDALAREVQEMSQAGEVQIANDGRLRREWSSGPDLYERHSRFSHDGHGISLPTFPS